MTFNIQKGGAGWSLAGRQIEEIRPDIVCLQEASTVQSDPKGAPIREALAGYFWAHERGVAVASRWPIRKTWVPDLRVESHGWAVFAEVEMPGGVLTVASVHLSPVQWDRFLSAELPKLPEHLRDAAKARQRQAQALIEEVNRLSSSARLILAGDFNGPPRGHLYRSFASRLNDAHAVAGSGFGWTIPAQFPMTRLDYVFSRGLTSHRAQVLPEAGSDHRGVLVDAEW